MRRHRAHGVLPLFFLEMTFASQTDEPGREKRQGCRFWNSIDRGYEGDEVVIKVVRAFCKPPDPSIERGDKVSARIKVPRGSRPKASPVTWTRRCSQEINNDRVLGASYLRDWLDERDKVVETERCCGRFAQNRCGKSAVNRTDLDIQREVVTGCLNYVRGNASKRSR